MALAGLGVEFEPKNPVVELMKDVKTGAIREEVLEEKVLSAILEFRIKIDRLEEVLKAIKEVATQINTVFSLDLISRVNPDGTMPALEIAKASQEKMDYGFYLLTQYFFIDKRLSIIYK